MANIKSAKKRILVDRRNAERNKAIKSKVKTAVKGVDAAIAAGDKDAASKALTTAISEINRLQKPRCFLRKAASRKISRITIAVNKIA